jgi:hypothetical protein
MLTAFFNRKEFAPVNWLPQGTSFTMAHFVDSVIIPLANRQVQQRGDIACGKLHLHFDNSNCHTARYVQEEMASHLCICVVPPLHSPEFAIADFYLFGRFKQQFTRRALDSEQNVFETVAEVLSGQRKMKEKVDFGIRMKSANGWQTTAQSSIRIIEMPSDFRIVSAGQ